MTEWFKGLFRKHHSTNDDKSSVREEPILHEQISEEEKKTIDKAVSRTIEEYGETLKRLGNE